MAYITHMGELIKPTQVHLVTREGEVKLNIVIDLNINLNTGNVEVKQGNALEKKVEQEESEKTLWAIPNFVKQEKVKFGKKKEQE